MMNTEFMTRVYLKLATKSNQPQECWHHEKDRILVAKWHSSIIAYNRFIRLKGIDSYKLHKSRLMLNTVLKKYNLQRHNMKIHLRKSPELVFVFVPLCVSTGLMQLWLKYLGTIIIPRHFLGILKGYR